MRTALSKRMGRDEEQVEQEQLRQLQLESRLGRTSGSTLHRGRLADGTPVLVKRAEEGADFRVAAVRLREERALFERLAEAGLGPRPLALLGGPAAPALVLQDRAGELLEAVLGGHALSVPRCLVLVVDLARELAELHGAKLVHGDLRPANVLVELDGEAGARACLVDLSRATREGTPVRPEAGDDFAYFSPERTGRVGRGVDGRSDLYSLGVVLYRLLTGQLPFTASDSLEWVHCHVARQPRPPADLGPVPRAASDIAMKLLAKLPDDRYQSAQGLAYDLEQCLEQCRSGDDRPFTLGAHDVSDRFKLPGRLYGREAELEALLRAVRRTAESGSPGLVLVAGYSGIGKSSLVFEARRPLAEARALYGWGKFERYRRGSPHAVLAKALGEIVQQILAGSEEEAARWRALLREALGSQGQLIVELVPQLELLVGPQPPVPVLAPKEAESRFQRILQRFLGALAAREHPIALFLDDLHWADTGTLGLLEYVVSHPDSHHLLLIGAYRDSEVSSTHPLTGTVEALRGKGVAVETIVPGLFSPEDATRLVADTLRCDAPRCEPLARLIHERTEGNPFFFIQFLSLLYDEGLLAFDRERREWRWDLDRIGAKGHTENVAELMAAKLGQLPEAARRAIRLAGFLGNAFDLDTLALVSGRSRPEVEQDLSEAVERGLVRATPEGTLRFAHDTVQGAAYGLVPEEESARLHIDIGRLLLAQTGSKGLGDRVYSVVSHFQRGEALLEAGERLRLAELELEAGRRAQASMAYRAAAQVLAQGQAHLPPDAWQSHYALSYGLALERARCEWLSGNFAAAEEGIAVLLREARSRVERAEAYRLKIDLLTTRGQFKEGVLTTLEACAQVFGLEFPLHPSPEDMGKAVARVFEALGGRDAEQLLDLPEMADPELQALVAIASSALPNMFFVDQMLHHLVVCEIVRLSIQHGNSPYSSHAYVDFAVTIGYGLRRWDDAFRFSYLACTLAHRCFSASKVGTYYLAGVLAHQVYPPGEDIELLRTSWQAALDGGDANHGCYAGITLIDYRLEAGEPLADVAEEARRQLEFCRSTKNVHSYDSAIVFSRFVESLRGGTRRLGSFDGPGFDSAAFEAKLAPNPTYLPEAYYGYRAWAELLSGDFEAALATSAQGRPYAQEGPISANLNYWLIEAMAASGRHDELGPEERPRLVDAMRACRERLRAQASLNPAVFGCSLVLVSAELARLEGRDLDAMRCYDEAMAAARDGGFAYVEAMAGEAAARFYRQRGSATGATAYLRAARDAYHRWGAAAKVKALELEHPEIRPECSGPGGVAARDGGPQIDLLATARASQAISAEIDLTRLVDTLLRTAVESAGAQTGWLLLERGGALSLAAQARVSGPGIEVQVLTGPPGEVGALPRSILAYVRRSREPVILDDAASPNPYSADAGLRRRGARSVLCLPIVRQGAFAGLLYLENDLIPSAFTPERLAVLELLAAQAAISLELSRHREQLEGLVDRRTEELTRANESLKSTNQKLERAHQQLLQAEKMASIGQLAAGVAHEINNPVSYVASNVGTLESYVREVMVVLQACKACSEEPSPEQTAEAHAAMEALDLEEIRGDLGSLVADVKHGLERVKTIVKALRTFSRVGETRWQTANLRAGLESTLSLMASELERRAVVVVEYGETPDIECLPSELNQVFMNLLVNAAQAIPDRGTITVRTGRGGEEVWVEVGDTGVGIAPENMKKIFDPFFTTKPVGEGVGLGLSLAYGIVEKHHGRIEVTSEQGAGTRFRIWLPVRQPAAEPSRA